MWEQSIILAQLILRLRWVTWLIWRLYLSRIIACQLEKWNYIRGVISRGTLTPRPLLTTISLCATNQEYGILLPRNCSCLKTLLPQYPDLLNYVRYSSVWTKRSVYFHSLLSCAYHYANYDEDSCWPRTRRAVTLRFVIRYGHDRVDLRDCAPGLVGEGGTLIQRYKRTAYLWYSQQQ
jgi:hypothetical protein